MTNSSCGCGHGHDDEKEEVGGHECCGGGCHEDTTNDDCGCGHDHCDKPLSPEDMAKLKKAIIEAGYQIEETPEGEIRILEN